MSHIPYGYIVKNGKAIIDEHKAKQIQSLFAEYLKCGSIRESAKRAGIEKTHCVIGSMMANRRYIGDDFYPQIIDNDTFDRAAEIRRQRAEYLGRNKPRKSAELKKKYTYFLNDTGDIDEQISSNADISEIQKLLFRKAELTYKSIVKR